MAEPSPPKSERRVRRLVMLALGAAAIAWFGGIIVATIAVRNAPDTSSLDTELAGVDQPEEAKQPTKGPVVPPATKVRAEGPCWPVYGRTAARTSDASDLDHGIPRRRTWQMRIGIMEFPPAYCDGVLYVNSQRGFTYAIRAFDKRLLWKQKTAEVYDSTPAVSGQRIFVGSYTPPAVQALDRRTGRRLWRLNAGGPVESSPVVVGGLVYATSKDRRVYAIDERTGRVRWAFRTGGEVKDSPSVVGGRVYVGNYAAQVFALDAKTGRVHWQKSYGGVLGDRIYSSVPIVGRTAYFATVRGNIYAVDSRDGSTRWQASIPGYVYSTPAISKGRLFLGNYPGSIYAFDARTGRRLWRTGLNGSISGSPTVIGDVVYVSTLSGSRTYGLSVRNGRILWEHGDGRYVSGIATDRALYLSMGSIISRWTSAQSERRLAAQQREAAATKG